MKKSVFQRFWDKVLVGGNGCWLWQAALSPSGQGKFGLPINGKWTTQVASRVAWFLTTGKWPEKNVLHKCDTPSCMRHSHHFEGTQQDNIKDCVNKGRHTGGKVYATHCIRGHEFSVENTWIHDGRRYCRTCRKAWKRNTRATRSVA